MERQPTTDRMIQEYVPGKQVTLAHLIANPGKDLFKKLGDPVTQGEPLYRVYAQYPADLVFARRSCERATGYRIGVASDIVAAGDVMPPKRSSASRSTRVFSSR